MSRLHVAEQLRLRGRPREALAEILRELALDPKSVGALIELAWIFIELKEPDEALRAAEQALSVEPRNAFAMYVRANSLGTKGKLDAAAECLEAALAITPWVESFHSYYASVCLCQRRLDDALESSARALAIDPHDAYALCVRVRALRASFRDDEALALTRTALSLHPEHAALLAQLGELSLANNDAHTAGTAFRSALRLDPAQPGAKSGLVDALRARSAIYRRASGFMRVTDRVHARSTARRAKQIGLGYLLVCVAIGMITENDIVIGILFLPLSLALIVGLIWFCLYFSMHFVVPLFLVPVLFDPLGKHALWDTLQAKGLPRQLKLIALGATVGLCMFCPSAILPVALCLPFLAAWHCPPGKARKLGFGLALLADAVAGVGLWKAHDGSFDSSAANWVVAGAAVVVVLAIWSLLTRRRMLARARPAR